MSKRNDDLSYSTARRAQSDAATAHCTAVWACIGAGLALILGIYLGLRSPPCLRVVMDPQKAEQVCTQIHSGCEERAKVAGKKADDAFKQYNFLLDNLKPKGIFDYATITPKIHEPMEPWLVCRIEVQNCITSLQSLFFLVESAR